MRHETEHRGSAQPDETMTLRGRTRALTAFIASALLLVATPSSASGATTVGDADTPDIGCTPGFTILQSTSPGDDYAAPEAGVITSWSFRATALPPQLKLKVGRPAGGERLTIIGESAVETLAANQLNTFPAQIPVQAGDVIGFYVAADGHCQLAASGYGYHYRDEDVPPGTTATFLSLADGAKVTVSANLETKKCKGAAPTMAGTEGNDTLVGTNANDVIVGLGGKDTLKGAGGRDKLCGLKGEDKIKGGRGKDFLNGGGGKDKCVGGPARDIAKNCEIERSI